MTKAISLVVITLNEAHNIERCIRSVPWADEVIILDTFSQDETKTKAEALGAKVFQEEWRGFGKQKARATELAKNDWILSLDADEALSPELAKEIEGLDFNTNVCDAYQIPRLSYYLGRWIRHGGWYPDYQTRLFNRKSAAWTEREVHEAVKFKSSQKLKSCILHYVFNSISEQVRTNDRYSSLGAVELNKKSKKFSLIKLIFKPLSKFLECYILKKGFMDGLPGFIIAIGAGYSVFLKFAKLWEMQKLK